MKNKLYIAVIVAVIVLVSAFALGILNLPEKAMGVRYTQDEFTMFAPSTGLAVNTASLSATADDDIILYGSDGIGTGATLSVGDIVMFQSTAALPQGIEYNTYYSVVTASTSAGFEIASTSTDTAPLDIGTDSSAGETYTFTEEFVGRTFKVEGYEFTTIGVDFNTSPSISLRFVGSISDSSPNWTDPQSATNSYDFISINDLQNATETEGDVVFEAAAADHRMFQIYPSGLKWITVMTRNFGAGSTTAKAKGVE